jgi:hypothetical protein
MGDARLRSDEFVDVRDLLSIALQEDFSGILREEGEEDEDGEEEDELFDMEEEGLFRSLADEEEVTMLNLYIGHITHFTNKGRVVFDEVPSDSPWTDNCEASTRFSTENFLSLCDNILILDNIFTPRGCRCDKKLAIFII